MKKLIFAVLCVISILFFTVGTALAMAHPWPQFRADAQNTGSVDNRGPRTGTLLWTFDVGYIMFSSPAVAGDGRVFVGDKGGYINAINSNGSSYAWNSNIGEFVDSSPALHSLGWVYVGSGDNNFYALNANGTMYWSYNLLDDVYSPTLSPDGARVYVGDNNNCINVINFDGSTPSPWFYRTGEDVRSSPALDSNGNVYVGSDNNNVYALNSNMTFSWSYRTGNSVSSSPAIGALGIYVGSEDNNLYALNFNGSLSWSYNTQDDIDHASAAVTYMHLFHPPYFLDSVYIGGNAGRLYKFMSGSLSWSYVTGTWVFSSPAIGSDDYIYVGSGVRLHAVTPFGLLAWSYVTGDWVASSPAIGDDGKLYVSCMDNYLYCFQDPPKLGLLVRQASNDLNIYFWNVPDVGDWTQWDALARNPSPLARDFWQIPIGNDGIGLTSIDIASDDLALLVRQASNDLNIYFWNSPVDGDWTRWDALARNPSPLARDFWQIPIGNDGIGLTSIDISEPPDESDEIALLVRQASNDLNLYFWNSPVDGDWTQWDALARNPSPLARDFWQIPIGNDGIGLTSIDISEPADGKDEIALLVRQGVNDLNVYFWNSPAEGDWTRWDALARNPSPLARDFWQIPIGNDGIGITSIDVDGNGRDDIGLLVRQGANDLNIYFWNSPVVGDWTQWDALARNPSPLARDFWQIPIGNDGIGLTGIAME